MDRFRQYRLAWLMSLLVLALLSFFGPWAFDQVNVPAGYECYAPYIRLQGDFCGAPVRGVTILGVVVGVLMRIPVAWYQSGLKIADVGREILFSTAFLLPFLSLVTTVGRIKYVQSRRWRVLNLVVWAAGTLVVVYFLVGGVLAIGLWPIRTWGSWLYIVTAALMIITELTRPL